MARDRRDRETADLFHHARLFPVESPRELGGALDFNAKLAAAMARACREAAELGVDRFEIARRIAPKPEPDSDTPIVEPPWWGPGNDPNEPDPDEPDDPVEPPAPPQPPVQPPVVLPPFLDWKPGGDMETSFERLQASVTEMSGRLEAVYREGAQGVASATLTGDRHIGSELASLRAGVGELLRETRASNSYARQVASRLTT